jgi:hypothetical protein
MDANTEKFWVIQVIPKNGPRGYIIDKPGTLIMATGICADTKRFYDFGEAERFIKNNRLNNKGNRAYARDSDELMNMKEAGLKTIDQIENETGAELVFIENEVGQRLCHNSRTGQYYFSNVKVGYCVWHNHAAIEKMAENLGKDMNMVLSVKKVKNVSKD